MESTERQVTRVGEIQIGTFFTGCIASAGSGTYVRTPLGVIKLSPPMKCWSEFGPFTIGCDGGHAAGYANGVEVAEYHPIENPWELAR